MDLANQADWRKGVWNSEIVLQFLNNESSEKKSGRYFEADRSEYIYNNLGRRWVALDGQPVEVLNDFRPRDVICAFTSLVQCSGKPGTTLRRKIFYWRTLETLGGRARQRSVTACYGLLKVVQILSRRCPAQGLQMNNKSKLITLP